jgi:hypothetical protein
MMRYGKMWKETWWCVLLGPNCTCKILLQQHVQQVGSQPRLEIGKDCVVIVDVFVVQNVLKIHVGF